jgi:hypothetical protein
MKWADNLAAIAEIEMTARECPSQWEGRLEDGRPFYIRYRWGELTLDIGAVGGTVDDAVNCPEQKFSLQTNDILDGRMEIKHMLNLSGFRLKISETP